MIVHRSEDECLSWIRLESLATEEMTEVLTKMESGFTLREGFLVRTEGTCSKGPQGFWWDVTLYEFETAAGFELAVSILTDVRGET